MTLLRERRFHSSRGIRLDGIEPPCWQAEMSRRSPSYDCWPGPRFTFDRAVFGHRARVPCCFQAHGEARQLARFVWLPMGRDLLAESCIPVHIGCSGGGRGRRQGCVAPSTAHQHGGSEVGRCAFGVLAIGGGCLCRRDAPCVIGLETRPSPDLGRVRLRPVSKKGVLGECRAPTCSCLHRVVCSSGMDVHGICWRLDGDQLGGRR